MTRPHDQQAPIATVLAAVACLATKCGVAASLARLSVGDLRFLAGLPLTVTLRVDDMALSDDYRTRLYGLLGLRSEQRHG